MALSLQQKLGIWDLQQAAYVNAAELEFRDASVVFGVDNVLEAFRVRPKTVVCIDERVSLFDPEEPEIGVAGNGILMDENQYSVLVQQLRDANVTEITYHEGCGACAVYCKAHPNKECEDVSKQSAIRLHATLGLAGQPKKVGYSANAEYKMSGDKTFHDARAIIIDGTGCFNAAVLSLPRAFHLSARYYGKHNDYMNAELGIAQQIALSEHGFDQEHFAREPLMIILVGDPTNADWTVEALRQRLQPALCGQFQHLTKVVGLTAPKGAEGLF